MENSKKISSSSRYSELKKIKEELQTENIKDNQIKDLLIKLLNYQEINSKEINVTNFLKKLEFKYRECFQKNFEIR